jgi:hypothetical protein
MLLADILMLLTAVAAAVLLVVVVRWRRQTFADHNTTTAGDEICEHLRPAWELLASRGHRVVRVGQKHPDLPLEIHLAPPFDPQAIHDELNLTDPVFVSERKVLFCKDDWCEIHPID